MFSFNSYVYYLIRGFVTSTRAFNLPTHAFNLATHAFSYLTRGFELVTRGFEIATRGLELATRAFELVTRVLYFHCTKSFYIYFYSELIYKDFINRDFVFSILYLIGNIFINILQ